MVRKIREKLHQTSPEAAKLLQRWSVIMGAVIIISNVVATRIWSLTELLRQIFGWQLSGWPEITFDAGLIIFPVAYIYGDLLSEIFGRKIADAVAYSCCVMCAIFFGTLWLADFLPSPTGMTNIVFTNALELSMPVILGSIAGYLVQQLLNNWVFAYLRKRTSEDSFLVRSWLSSIPARIADTLVFNTVAFGWRMSWAELLPHMLYAYIAATILEFTFSLFVKPYVKKLKAKLGLHAGPIERLDYVQPQA